MKGKWTPGPWSPEKEKPTFNPGANAYQRAIIQVGKGRIIPGFAFGETAEECTANAWLIASAKELLRAVQAFRKGDPDASKIAESAEYIAMGHLEIN